ncbi:MAG: hypothetical protein QOC81_3542 [Thermoanaerobaculia bacterium]|nr:hypothetical protein [Thermoanaerobaculia bacterium]
MPAQIVFLTLYLGLLSGRQPVDVQVGPDVKSVQFLVDGRVRAALKAPPWSATIDFGSSFDPVDLVAIAYDRDGDEIGRISQLINLPRPSAEIILNVRNDAKGAPVSAELQWEHVYAAKPSLATVAVDGKNLKVDSGLRAMLPKLDIEHPHVISAEMRFTDGTLARRELVIAGGAVSDSISTELTPVVVTGKLPAKNPKLDGCLSANGVPLRARAVETPEAQVWFIREPDANEVTAAIDPDHYLTRSWREVQKVRRGRLPLDQGTTMRFTWPIVRRMEIPGHVSSNIFDTSLKLTPQDLGMVGLLTISFDEVAAQNPLRPVEPGAQRRFADAVAVAGLAGITGGHRRAIVLVVDCNFALKHDRSSARPEAVRQYLESVGVPLFVWSVSGPRPDLEPEWGAIDDISDPRQFQASVQRLRDSLASQHVVWIPSDPLTALHVEVEPRCGVRPLARLRH